MVFMTLRLLAKVSIALSATIFVARFQLAGWYSTNPEIVDLAASMLMWVAAYHLADGTQAVSAFLLRCYRITLAPLAIYGVLLWGVGLWGGYQLTYQGLGAMQATQQARSFWIASTVAIICVAIALLGLLLRAVFRSQVSAKGQR
jgi:MATE family multidrug resistance protein